jgi:hypothetical protein
MRKIVLLNVLVILASACTSCSSLRVSKFSVFNQFTYAEEQPQFHFKNDTLGIEGAWNWASSARAIPTISYIPTIPLRILKSIAKPNERILFATWLPNRNKYDRPGSVEVTKDDVHYVDKNNKPLFIIVLTSGRGFKPDTSKFRPKGRNGDYQFELFATSPELSSFNYWEMEIVAATKDRYYDFVCIMDQSYVADPKVRDYQADQFLDDVKIRFLTK